MPIEYVPPLLLVFVVGLGAAMLELRAAFQPPVCPQCGHCRLEALRRQERERRAHDLLVKRYFGVEDPDDDEDRRIR